MALISFTQSAQNALNRAVYTAREMGHSYVGTEHLLLGLLGEKGCTAARLLEEKNVSFDTAREKTVETLGTGRGTTSVGVGDMTPRTKQIIELSSFQAVKLGQRYIGTEHLLLANPS